MCVDGCAFPPRAPPVSCRYFVRKFRTRNQHPEREMFHHVTCAVDKSNVRVVGCGARAHVLSMSAPPDNRSRWQVFDACRDIILNESIASLV